MKVERYMFYENVINRLTDVDENVDIDLFRFFYSFIKVLKLISLKIYCSATLLRIIQILYLHECRRIYVL